MSIRSSELFHGEGYKEKMCPICLDVPSQLTAMELTCCGHLICSDCLDKHMQTDLSCPSCHESLNKNGPMQITKHVKRELSSLQVRCKKSKNGCEWIGNWADLDQHIGLCHPEDALVQCRWDGCGVKLPRSEIQGHQSGKCQFRLFSCNLCTIRLKFKDLQKHVEVECPNMPMACPLSCGNTLPRSLLPDHTSNICTKRKITCFVKGCNEEFTPDMLPQHMTNNLQQHFSLMCMNIDALQIGHTQLLGDHRRLQQEHAGLTTTLHQLQADYNFLRQAYQQLTHASSSGSHSHSHKRAREHDSNHHHTHRLDTVVPHSPASASGSPSGHSGGGSPKQVCFPEQIGSPATHATGFTPSTPQAFFLKQGSLAPLMNMHVPGVPATFSNPPFVLNTVPSLEGQSAPPTIGQLLAGPHAGTAAALTVSKADAAPRRRG